MKKLILGSALALCLAVAPVQVSAYITGTNTEGGMYVVNCDEWISLRASASMDSPALASIPLGAKVTVLDDGDPCYQEMVFAHVSYGGQTGYALYEYLTSSWTMYTVVNCNESISLREAPSVDAAAIMQVPLGERVRFVRDEGNGFYCVAYRDNMRNDQLGFVLSDYLE